MSEEIINQTRVKASAKVEMIRFAKEPVWNVEVWGEEPYDYRRTYTIKAKTDNDAAFTGIQLFVEEMESLEVLREV